MIALGAHNRPPETATILLLKGFNGDESKKAGIENHHIRSSAI